MLWLTSAEVRAKHAESVVRLELLRAAKLTCHASTAGSYDHAIQQATQHADNWHDIMQYVERKRQENDYHGQ